MKVNSKKFFKPKYVIMLAVIIVIVYGGWRFVKNKFYSSKSVSAARTTVVKRGDLSSVVTGSAPIESASKATILSKVNSTVKKVYFKAGDKVKAGDLLYELDSTDAEINVSRNNLTVQQNEINLNSAVNDASQLNVIAPFDGIISGIKVEAGSKMGSNDVLFTITDNSKFKLTVPFNLADSEKLSVGMNVSVNIEDVMETVNGKIINIGSSYTGNSGNKLCNVDIEIDNPGALKEGMNASAEVNSSGIDIRSTENGSLAYENKQSVNAGITGTVESVNASENKAVKKGDIIIKIDNDQLAVNKQSAELKLTDASLQLQAAQNSLLDYKIYAPVDGTLVEQEINEGDSVKQSQELAVISDTSKMQFSIDVDELDISKIKKDQDVTITVDALTNTSTNPITGKVESVAEIGTSSNGVTTYPVTINIDKADNLKEGMNANASIVIDSRSDVLLVPVEAIHKINGKNYVMMQSAEGANNNNNANISRIENSNNKSSKETQNTNGSTGSGGTSSTGNYNRSSSSSGTSSTRNYARSSSGSRASSSSNSSYYANTVPVEVEIGMNNETYVEIISGVKEGDVVLLPSLSTSSSQTSQTQTMGMPFGGGMGGQMEGGSSRSSYSNRTGGNSK